MSQPIIFVADDDASVRKALARLIRSAGMATRTFASAEDFLDANLPLPNCLIVDLCMPGMSGLELQQRLAQAGQHVPLVFISAHDDERARQAALAGGALAFLHKPFDDEALLKVLTSVVAQESQPRH